MIIILGYLTFAVSKYASKDSSVVCKRLDIHLLDKDKIQLISETDISKILAGNDLNPIGKNFRQIRTEKIEDQLKDNPMIKSAECYKTPSGTIVLNVEQRTPKFIISGQENYYVDNDRKILPVSLNYAVYVPVVSGRITHAFAKGKLFDFVSYVIDNSFWNDQIEQIYVRDDQTVELIPRVGDAVIYMGKLDDYEKKLDHLLKLYKFGFNEMGWNRYKKIDLQYDDQIVCTKRNAKDPDPTVDITQNNDSSEIKKL